MDGDRKRTTLPGKAEESVGRCPGERHRWDSAHVPMSQKNPANGPAGQPTGNSGRPSRLGLASLRELHRGQTACWRFSAELEHSGRKKKDQSPSWERVSGNGMRRAYGTGQDLALLSTEASAGRGLGGAGRGRRGGGLTTSLPSASSVQRKGAPPSTLCPAPAQDMPHHVGMYPASQHPPRAPRCRPMLKPRGSPKGIKSESFLCI